MASGHDDLAHRDTVASEQVQFALVLHRRALVPELTADKHARALFRRPVRVRSGQTQPVLIPRSFPRLRESLSKPPLTCGYAVGDTGVEF